MQKILIIEDEKALGKIYEKYLNSEGFIAKWIDSIEAAQKLSESFQPDLVLLDQGLPSESRNGIEALPDLKKLFPKARFVIFSNYSAFALENKALEAGADAYWVKVDIRLNTLTKRILELLR
jgi:DNA-binding response OmpR family regulator